MTLTLYLQDSYSSDMGQLRKVCFPTDYQNSDDKDEFDNYSTYVVISDESSLVAYGRLTPGPNAVFYTWTKAKAQVPYGQDAIDLGRCMVRPDYRRKNILRIICLAGLLIAKRKGFKHVNGAVVVGSGWLDMLEKIGLKKSGIVVQGKTDLIQPLSCNIDECSIDFENLLIATCEELAENEILIDIRL